MKHVNVVCALIENEKGEIFCCKRGPGRALEGLWEFPGGKIEEGESPQQSLVREIKEELRSEVEIINSLGCSFCEYKNLGSYPDFSISLFGFRCKLVSGSLELSEHVDSKWVSKKDLLNIIDDFAEADKYFLKRININGMYKVYLLENKKKSERCNPDIPSDSWDLAIELDKEGIPVMGRTFGTFTDFPDRFAEIAEDILRERKIGNDYIPIIHISGHGGPNGIGLYEAMLGTDYNEQGKNFFTWEQLKWQLDRINNSCYPAILKSPIILCMSTCYGINATKCDNYSSPGSHAAHVIIGHDDTILWDDAHKAFNLFYLSLLRDCKTVSDAVTDMNSAIGTPNYFVAKYLY